MKIPIRQLALCALFAALTAVLSQVALPIGPVPINLATLGVLLAGALLGARLGALSQLVYVLMGAFGMPVFAFFRGGFDVISGPTGGFIVGYIAAAWLVGLVAQRQPEKRILLAVLIAGASSYFLLGSLWFMYSLDATFAHTLAVCVLPFIPGDAAKIAAVMVIEKRVGFRG